MMCWILDINGIIELFFLARTLLSFFHEWFFTKNTWIGIHFFPGQFAISHVFGNMLDDSQNDFYHPYQSNEMPTDYDGLGN